MGMRTLREDGIRKVLAGLTTPEEVIRATVATMNGMKPNARSSDESLMRILIVMHSSYVIFDVRFVAVGGVGRRVRPAHPRGHAADDPRARHSAPRRRPVAQAGGHRGIDAQHHVRGTHPAACASAAARTSVLRSATRRGSASACSRKRAISAWCCGRFPASC